MEFSNFFILLKKHKFTIVIIPLITVIITYFLVRNQPDVYSSQAKIATGIVDQTQKFFSVEFGQDSQITQEFGNLVEMLRSKKILDQLAYQLMIHDLTSKDPYRKPSKLMTQLNESAKQHALSVFTDLYNKRQPLNLSDPDQNGMNKLIKSMHYDDQSIMLTLSIYRIQNSDYISVSFDAETPALSEIVVNTVCNEFIKYYSTLIKENQVRSVNYLNQLVNAKQDTLNKKIAALKNYKISHHILNLDEQAKNLYSQMSDFETRREEALKGVQSTQAAINRIDKQFDPTDRRYAESNKISITQDIENNKVQLNELTDQYVQNGFDPQTSSKIDSLKALVSKQIAQLSDKYVLSPLPAKQALLDQKLNLQVQNDLAKHSEGAINTEIGRLNSAFNALVPNEGNIQSLENAVSVASQEYLAILQKYNQAGVESNMSVKLKLLEIAEPGIPQPSKKLLLVILSGVITFIFCVVVLFIFFFFDNRIKTPRELANITQMPVLGHINLLKSRTIDLKEIWKGTITLSEIKQFRHLMQSVRYEIDNELADNKILLINSLTKATGKTFLAVNLAYAYSVINKKVLLIDANSSNPGITNFVKTKLYLEDFLKDNVDDAFLHPRAKLTFMGNKGGDNSILELCSDVTIKEKLSVLKNAFDIIIIEASSLDTLNKSKEWTLFSDKILTVFKAGNKINQNDKELIQYLGNQKDKFIGLVLNMVQNDKAGIEDE